MHMYVSSWGGSGETMGGRGVVGVGMIGGGGFGFGGGGGGGRGGWGFGAGGLGRWLNGHQHAHSSAKRVRIIVIENWMLKCIVENSGCLDDGGERSGWRMGMERCLMFFQC